MPEQPPNPFEAVPNLQPAIVRSLEIVRAVFNGHGIDLTRFVLAVEIKEYDPEGKPLCTAASWPMNEMDKAADLARQARTIFEMAHASKHTRGQG